MKTRALSCALLLGLSLSAVGQTSLTKFSTPLAVSRPDSLPLTVLAQGPHDKIIQSVSSIIDADGLTATQTNTFTQIETGLSYQDEKGQWQDAVASFEPFSGGAIARRVQHQVILSPNANTQNAVDLLMPDGTRVVSHVLGLGYFDQATGASVTIAELQDSSGELSPAGDQVTYPNAFTGVAADLRYTLTRAGLEQDVILT